ncbi:MAG: response regulator [Nitrospirales bacterium]|nr:response regulator [Nitrospirales bacterium]
MITDTRMFQSHSDSPKSLEEHTVMSQPGSSHAPERSAGIFSGQNYRGGVLIVDDEADIRKVLSMALEKEGYYVINAEDGKQAIRLLNEGEHPMVIDVIITDIRMPNINGIQAIEYFQREYPSVPLIVLTGFPELDLATQLLKRGVTDFLVKPIDRTKLISAVADAIGTRHLDWFA